MMMFNEWVRRNDDIRTLGMREHQWGPAVATFGGLTSIVTPEGNWVAILLFEVIGDVITRSLRDDRSGNLHPILQQLGLAHSVEESRHIAFATTWLRNRLETLWQPRVYLLQRFTEMLAKRLLHQSTVLPLPYNAQIERFMTREEFCDARSSERSGLTLRTHVHETIAMLRDMGLIREQSLNKWEATGLFEASLLPQ